MSRNIGKFSRFFGAAQTERIDGNIEARAYTTTDTWTNMKTVFAIALFTVSSLWAQTHPLQQLIEAARTNAPNLKDLIASGLPGLKGRDGAAVWGQEFLFAVESEKPAIVSIDKQPPVGMTSIPGTKSLVQADDAAAGNDT